MKVRCLAFSMVLLMAACSGSVSDSDFEPSDLPDLTESQVDRLVVALKAMNEFAGSMAVFALNKQGRGDGDDTDPLLDACAMDVDEISTGTMDVTVADGHFKLNGSDCPVDYAVASSYDIAGRTTEARFEAKEGMSSSLHSVLKLEFSNKLERNASAGELSEITRATVDTADEKNIQVLRVFRASPDGTDEKIEFKFSDFTAEFIAKLDMSDGFDDIKSAISHFINGTPVPLEATGDMNLLRLATDARFGSVGGEFIKLTD